MQDKQKSQDVPNQEHHPLNERIYPLIVDMAIMIAIPDTGYDSSMLESLMAELGEKGYVPVRLQTQYSIVLEGGDYHLPNWKLAAADFDAMIADSSVSCVQYEQLNQCIKLLQPYTTNQLIKKIYQQLNELLHRVLLLNKRKEKRTKIESIVVLVIIALVIAATFVFKNYIVP